MTSVPEFELSLVKVAVLDIGLFPAMNDITCLPWKERESKPGFPYLNHLASAHRVLCRAISITTSSFVDLCLPTHGKNSDIENSLPNWEVLSRLNLP
jgi:hypothetical protein